MDSYLLILGDRTGCGMISSLFWGLINQNSWEQATAMLRRELVPPQSGIIFIPLNIHGGHWALGVLYCKEREYQYFDSFYNSNNHKQFENIMVQILNIVRGPSEVWRKGLAVSVPQQMNQWDCGVFCLYFASRLAQHNLISNEPLDTNQMRIQITLDICHRFTGEES